MISFVGLPIRKRVQDNGAKNWGAEHEEKELVWI